MKGRRFALDLPQQRPVSSLWAGITEDLPVIARVLPFPAFTHPRRFEFNDICRAHLPHCR
jgi:hypothetical protein